MRRRSIQRPLLIYALFFMLALAISVVTIGALSLLRTARATQRELLAAEAVRISETASWPVIRDVFAGVNHEHGIGVVGPGTSALGLTLEDARVAAARPEANDSIGAIPLRSPGEEAYVVFRTEPALGFAIAQREIRTLLAFALIIAVTFGALLAVLISRLVLSPIGDLQRVASGIDLSDPVLGGAGIETPNEVAEVAQTFRRTIRKLQEERENIARARDELETMQAGLIRASKLASVGRLAAGVAHEIGNPLSAVLGYLDLLRRGLEPKDQQDVLERSEKELRRIHDTIKKLLTYARADESKEAIGPFSSGAVAADTIALLRGHPALRSVEMSDGIGSTAIDVIGRPTALQQVLMNLMINAGHAGAKTISLRREVSEDRVAVSVKDDGAGIAPEILEHIFDPFFTTKAPGEGTGLGLAVSRSLVEAMDGALEVSSRPGEGATFTIRLPKAEGGG